MSDDRTRDASGGGFDDWLDDEPGPATDPYQAAPPDDTDPESSPSSESPSTDDLVSDETAEIEPTGVPTDAEEIEVTSGGIEEAEDADDIDDTGELEPMGSIGFGDLLDDGETDEMEAVPHGEGSELRDLSHASYLEAATREHADLAESIARADGEVTEQVALTAAIPGLDATVVGFEDVVEAEGHGRVRARVSGDLVARAITGVALVAALGASLLWRPALVVFALGVFVLSAGEFYTALVRSDRKPIALFGFVGIVGASLGAFFLGALWIPIALILATTALLLYYAVVPDKTDPMGNLALTVAVMAWVGLGSFTMLIAGSESYRVLIFGVVVTVAAMDIAQYFFGRTLGKHPLSPWVSPKKTIEGLVAGVVVALTVGALLHFLKPFELTSGLAIGAAVAVLAPVGDLAMSAAKRSLGLKDMGSVLPGHGGFLDRIDGLLFVIPAAWAIFVWAGIL